MSNQMAQLQEATIKAQCKSLRMPMIASQFGTLAEQAIREKKSYVGYLEALLLAEVEERERNTIERRIREAHLPQVRPAELADQGGGIIRKKSSIHCEGSALNIWHNG